MAAPQFQQGNPVDQVLARTKDIAVLPHVVFKIMELSGSDETSLATLERTILVDPGFSAKILAVANSAAYALPKRCTSIREAVMFIGLRQVRQICMTVGLLDTFMGRTDKDSMRKRGWWRMSVDTALCAKSIAAIVPGVEPDTAYSCALLHLIGKTVLDRYNPSEYAKVEMLLERGAQDVMAEIAVFKCDHVTIGRELTKRWGLPNELCEGLAYAEPLEPENPHAKTRAVVSISHDIADFARTGHKLEDDDECPFQSWAMDATGLGNQNHHTLINRGLTAIAEGAHMHA